MDADRLAQAQLRRMRAMTALYHRQFFGDVRFTLVVLLAIFAAGLFGAEPMFLAAPPVALLGAAQAAFDASYLIFARQYAARLERYLNASAGQKILVGADLEAAYLFPLDRRKMVTVAVGDGFTWFGLMTILYTVLGAAAFITGLAASWSSAFETIGGGWTAAYLVSLGVVTIATIGAGVWWFWGGTGERRLRDILDDAFPA
jgi:hypothetical protein